MCLVTKNINFVLDIHEKYKMTFTTMQKLVIVFTCVTSYFAPQITANPDAKRLYDDLLSNYNRLIRPVSNNTDTILVKLGLRLSQLIELVSKQQYVNMSHIHTHAHNFYPKIAPQITISNNKTLSSAIICLFLMSLLINITLKNILFVYFCRL